MCNKQRLSVEIRRCRPVEGDKKKQGVKESQKAKKLQDALDKGRGGAKRGTGDREESEDEVDDEGTSDDSED